MTQTGGRHRRKALVVITMHNTTMFMIGMDRLIKTVCLQFIVMYFVSVIINEPTQQNTFAADISVPLSFGSHTSPMYAEHGPPEQPMLKPISMELAYSVVTSSANKSMTCDTMYGMFVITRHLLCPRRPSVTDDNKLPTGVNKYNRLPATNVTAGS